MNHFCCASSPSIEFGHWSSQIEHPIPMKLIPQRRPFHSLATKVSEVPVFPSNNPRISHHHLRLLSCCKTLKSLLQIHGHLIVSGIRKDNFTLTHLINSYSLFQKFDLAWRVLDSTPNPGLILWNSMIRAYTRSRHYGEALKTYRYMLERGLKPDKHTFTVVLKACTGVLDLDEGFRIHHEIAQNGLECDLYIGTGLIDMYCKIGNLSHAMKAFGKMPRKNVTAWNAMVAGFSQSPKPYKALEYFRNMQMGGVELTSASLLNLFPAVRKLSDINSCRSLHGYVLKREFSNAVVNGLIDTHSKCGRADIARRIFDGMYNRDDISWGTMMSGYLHNGNFSDVFELLDLIKNEDLKMNNVCAVSALLAAAEMRDLEKGKEVHKHAIQQGIDSDVLVATPIVTMYAKCGEPQKAKQLFGMLQGRDLAAWSALIAVFVQSGSPEEALILFRDMQHENLKPNRTTLISALLACAELFYLRLGKSLHCYAVTNNIVSDLSIQISLVSLYAKCGILTSAQIIFNRMPMPCLDVKTWNALIMGYAQIGDSFHATEMFHKLMRSQVLPDTETMVGFLLACALLHDLERGTCIHGLIIRSGFDFDCHVKNALIDMYSQCGSLPSAEFLFNETEFGRTNVSWNVMIAGHVHNGESEKALSTFRQMKLESFEPDLVTLANGLHAAAYLVALREGMCIHACIIRMGFQSSTFIGNSLIDMYVMCGCLDHSNKVFNEINIKDTFSWNVLLAGYVLQGRGDHTVDIFSLMQESVVEVDSTSFVSILYACRHAGLKEEGMKYFNLMCGKYNIEPGLEHYACMADILGRPGLFHAALGLIEKTSVESDADRGFVKLEPGNPAPYVVLSSIYAQACR